GAEAAAGRLFDRRGVFELRMKGGRARILRLRIGRDRGGAQHKGRRDQGHRQFLHRTLLLSFWLCCRKILHGAATTACRGSRSVTPPREAKNRSSAMDNTAGKDGFRLGKLSLTSTTDAKTLQTGVYCG